MKKITLLSALLFISIMGNALTSVAQNQSLLHTQVKVLGSCEMCKKNIEKAAIGAGANKAEWNEYSKILQLSFNDGQTNTQDIEKAIALIGYDTQDVFASDSVYNALSTCCQYDRDVLKQSSEAKSALLLYYKIKDALVSGSAKTASENAILFANKIKGISPSSLKDNEKKVLVNLKSKLISESENIAKAKNVEKQRETFNTFSENVFTWMKSAEVKETIYQQYCSMKNAYWLSDNKAIKNPYYGNQMLTCGSVSEILNK